jgi:hypothetical protein
VVSRRAEGGVPTRRLSTRPSTSRKRESVTHAPLREEEGTSPQCRVHRGTLSTESVVFQLYELGSPDRVGLPVRGVYPRYRVGLPAVYAGEP